MEIELLPIRSNGTRLVALYVSCKNETLSGTCVQETMFVQAVYDTRALRQ